MSFCNESLRASRTVSPKACTSWSSGSGSVLMMPLSCALLFSTSCTGSRKLRSTAILLLCASPLLNRPRAFSSCARSFIVAAVASPPKAAPVRAAASYLLHVLLLRLLDRLDRLALRRRSRFSLNSSEAARGGFRCPCTAPAPAREPSRQPMR